MRDKSEASCWELMNGAVSTDPAGGKSRWRELRAGERGGSSESSMDDSPMIARYNSEWRRRRREKSGRAKERAWFAGRVKESLECEKRENDRKNEIGWTKEPTRKVQSEASGGNDLKRTEKKRT